MTTDKTIPEDLTDLPVSRIQRLGAVVQGLVFGGLLVVALLNLMRVASDAQVFRYQGF